MKLKLAVEKIFWRRELAGGEHEVELAEEEEREEQAELERLRKAAKSQKSQKSH